MPFRPRVCVGTVAAAASASTSSLAFPQATHAIEVLSNIKPKDGLFTTRYNVKTGLASNRLVTFGATGDSFFEYLVKAWIQVSEGSFWHG